MRRALAFVAVTLAPSTAYAGFEGELRVSRASIGVHTSSMSGEGVHEYNGEQSLSVRPRDEGYDRPTFTTMGIALGASATYAAILVTGAAGVGSADEPPSAGYSTALNTGSTSLARVGIEPRVQLPFGPVTFGLAINASVAWLSAPFRELRPRSPCRAWCGGRATATFAVVTPRLSVAWRVREPSPDVRHDVAISVGAFLAADVLYSGGGLWPLEGGLALIVSG